MTKTLTYEDKIVKALKEKGLKLGGWNEQLNKLPKNEFEKILEEIKVGIDSTDILVKMNGDVYICEVWAVDEEIDFGITPLSEYIIKMDETLEEVLDRFRVKYEVKGNIITLV